MEENATTKLRIIMGDDGLERLRSAAVAVLGIGGVGSNCTEALARGGVGTIAIVDKDVVAPSNINRQAIAYRSTVGKRKVDVMAAMIADINPDCHVVARHAFVLPDNLEALLDELTAACGGHLDYVVDALDTVATKLALAELAQSRGFALISSMGAANKLHPECLRICDINDTVRDPLARIVRKECRRRGIRHLQVLSSSEEPVRTAPREPGRERTELGTASFMPPIMGQMIAGEVLRRIAQVGCEPVRPDGGCPKQAH